MWRYDDLTKWADGSQNGPSYPNPKIIHQSVYLIMEDILFFGFAKILRVKKKFEDFQNRRRFFEIRKNSTFISTTETQLPILSGRRNAT